MDSPKSGVSKRHITLAIFASVALLLVTFKAMLQNQDAALLNLDACCEPEEPKQPTVWGGWQSVERIFVFGDSWSDTKFDVIGEQPSPEQPMGNPPFPGDRDTKGAKWPVHLTTAYNDSLIQTYCFARSGAAVVREIVKNNEADLVEEVEKDFLPGYVDFDFGQSEWKSASSLFIFFIGINDNHIAEKWDNIQEVHEQQMQSYSFLIDMLYDVGARNFLLMNVPPIGRAPVGDREITIAIDDWNSRLIDAAAEFRETHAGATVLEFDTFKFFNRVMDNAATFPETAHYTNLTEECVDYAGKDLELDSFSEKCGVPLRQYLWWDGLHPTGPVHEAMASQIAEHLRGHDIFNETELPEHTELRRGHKH